MSEKALYILAGYDSDTEAYLAEIQNELSKRGFIVSQTKGIPYHITMGEFHTEKENELISALNSIAKNKKAFDVTFNHLGIFQGGRVLFAAPDCNRELLELKEELGGGDNWTPHTTLLIDEPEIILNALPIVLNRFSSFGGKIISLHLYEFFPARHIISVNLEN